MSYCCYFRLDIFRVSDIIFGIITHSTTLLCTIKIYLTYNRKTLFPNCVRPKTTKLYARGSLQKKFYKQNTTIEKSCQRLSVNISTFKSSNRLLSENRINII